MILYLPERRCELQRTGTEERRRMTDESWYPVTPMSHDLWSERTQLGQTGLYTSVLHTSVRCKEVSLSVSNDPHGFWFDTTCSCGSKLCILMVCLSERWSTQRSNCFPINNDCTQKSRTRARIIHENGMHIQRSGKVCLKSFCCCFYCCLELTELI